MGGDTAFDLLLSCTTSTSTSASAWLYVHSLNILPYDSTVRCSVIVLGFRTYILLREADTCCARLVGSTAI